MANSQNGYKANDSSLIASYTIVRDVKINLRKGDASVVLLHFAKWFDETIEKLTKADTGGYNPRTIEGSTVLSNHASGTAMDLRWNRHPMGKRGTFTAPQAAKIRAQLKFYEGAIRWGGDYKSRADEMHFEINAAPTMLARIAKKCKPAAPKPPKPTPVPTLLVVDGILGPKTISKWQKVMGTTVDGKIDDHDSELIRAVQTKLRATVDHRLVVDGDPGPKTKGRLQSYLGVPVNQQLDVNTIKALQRRLNENRF